MQSVKPYNTGKGKTEEVERMFDSIAPAYDFMNTAMSLGLHRHWRNRALDALAAEDGFIAPDRVLDVACGTGDVSFELHRRFPKANITGVDLSENMLRIAENRLEKFDESEKKRISFEKGDCLHLKYPDSSFDVVTVAYGVRNFERLAEGLREMSRVLRENGKICIIELSEPLNPLALRLYRLYSRHLIPMVGKLVSGDSRAYSYLPESIAAAPQRDRMTHLMEEAGFSDCKWKSLSFGAVTYYLGTKNAEK